MTMEGGEDGLPIPEETLNEDDENIGIHFWYFDYIFWLNIVISASVVNPEDTEQFFLCHRFVESASP